MKPVRTPKKALTMGHKEQAQRQIRHGVDYGIAIKQRVFSGFGKNALSQGYEDVKPAIDDDVKDAVKNEEEPD